MERTSRFETETDRSVSAPSPVERLDAQAQAVSDLLGHLANPVRLRVICRLKHGEASVAELLRILNVSQSSLSQHLARLRNAGLVATRRQSKSIYYRLTSDDMEALVCSLIRIYCAGRDYPAPMPQSSLETE